MLLWQVDEEMESDSTDVPTDDSFGDEAPWILMTSVTSDLFSAKSQG